MALPSGLPEHVGDNEPLARFLTSRSQFTSTAVKASAFISNQPDGRASVFRQGADDRDALFRLGRTNLGERVLHGVAICSARQIRAAELDVTASEPPARHADITGWPSDPANPELAKSRRKEHALVLAQHVTLIRANA